MRPLRLGALRVRSLRTRFGLAVAALVLAAVAVFGVYVYVNVGRGLRNSLDDSLRVSASLAASTVRVSNDTLDVSDSVPENNNELAALLDEGYTVRYLDPTGTVLGGFGQMLRSGSDPATLAAARAGDDTFSNVAQPKSDRDYREYTLAIRSDQGVIGGYVQVLHDMRSIAEAVERLLGALLAGGVAVIVGGGLAGYFLARRALAPIDAITRTARKISGQDLSARLDLSGADDEVGRLASTFDEMLQRLDDSFQRERRFTADASHELRTPLAAMEAILGVVRSEPREPAEYEQALDDLAQETARLRTLVDDLLELARGSSATEAFDVVDLTTLVEDVVDALRPLAEAKDLSLTYSGQPDLRLSGDSDSLVRLFVNLVENAIKFTEAGTIAVTARSANGAVIVDVTDTGIGIAPDDINRIFDRFNRGDRSRATPGVGLGLSLAQQIAEAHRGTLTVTSEQGKGSTFTVTLPQAAT